MLPSYLDFENNYCNYMRAGINTIETDLCIPNDIFVKINGIALKANKQKCFLYSCYALLLLTNSFDDKNSLLNFKKVDTERQKELVSKYKKMSYCGIDIDFKLMCVSNRQLKTLWGYSPTNVKLDYIVANNGVMDKNGLTEFFIKGYKHIVYKADRSKGDYFKIPIDVMFYCIMTDDLRDIAFAIYSIICRAAQAQQKDKIMISRDYIKDIIGVDLSTISKYIGNLEKYNLLIVDREWAINSSQNEANSYTLIKDLDDRHFRDFDSRMYLDGEEYSHT